MALFVRRHIVCSRAAFLLLGGLLGGTAMWLFRPAMPVVPTIPLHASTAQAGENYALATGFVDDGMEAVYFLDFVTGDLRGTVMHPKSGKFTAFYTYNVSADFGANNRNSKYAMVTGLADLAVGRGSMQMAHSVIYIADVTSGKVCAYGMPWNPSLHARGQEQLGQFQPLDATQFRTAAFQREGPSRQEGHSRELPQRQPGRQRGP